MSSREQYNAAHQDEPVWPTDPEQTAALDRSVRAAMERDHGDIRRLFESKDAEIERLRAALEDALEGMQSMIGYVDEYFRDKWELDAYIERASAALEAGDV